MADNIKIVGNIVNTTTVSRYSVEDTNLIASRNLQEDFGGTSDYIEYYVYDIGGNLLNINYNYLSYKLPSTSGLTPAVADFPNTRGNIQTTDVGIESTLAPQTSSLFPVAARIGVGMRYFFTENIGANLGLGLGQGGLVNIGITAKF